MSRVFVSCFAAFFLNVIMSTHLFAANDGQIHNIADCASKYKNHVSRLDEFSVNIDPDGSNRAISGNLDDYEDGRGFIVHEETKFSYSGSAYFYTDKDTIWIDKSSVTIGGPVTVFGTYVKNADANRLIGGQKKKYKAIVLKALCIASGVQLADPIATPQPDVPKKKPPLVAAGTDPEERFWQPIQNTIYPGNFAAYLSLFPRGRYSSAAQSRAHPTQTYANTEPGMNCSRQADYPSMSKRNSEQGVVTIYLLIGADGELVDDFISASSGFPRLDQATKDGFESYCNYTPATVNGKPEPSWKKMQYTWRLN